MEFFNVPHGVGGPILRRTWHIRKRRRTAVEHLADLLLVANLRVLPQKARLGARIALLNLCVGIAQVPRESRLKLRSSDAPTLLGRPLTGSNARS